MPIVRQIDMCVLDKPAAFRLRAGLRFITNVDILLSNCTAGQLTPFQHENYVHSPSAGQLRCTVLPAGFITAWVMVFGFVKRGPI